MARVIAFLLLIVAIATINAVPLSHGILCGENEVYDSCGSPCPSTCQQPLPSACILSCKPGCACAEGYLKNAENKCVLTQNC